MTDHAAFRHSNRFFAPRTGASLDARIEQRRRARHAGLSPPPRRAAHAGAGLAACPRAARAARGGGRGDETFGVIGRALAGLLIAGTVALAARRAHALSAGGATAAVLVGAVA